MLFSSPSQSSVRGPLLRHAAVLPSWEINVISVCKCHVGAVLCVCVSLHTDEGQGFSAELYCCEVTNVMLPVVLCVKADLVTFLLHRL